MAVLEETGSGKEEVARKSVTVEEKCECAQLSVINEFDGLLVTFGDGHHWQRISSVCRTATTDLTVNISDCFRVRSTSPVPRYAQMYIVQRVFSLAAAARRC